MWSTPAVWKQYNKMAVLHFFRVNSSLIYSILFVFVNLEVLSCFVKTLYTLFSANNCSKSWPFKNILEFWRFSLHWIAHFQKREFQTFFRYFLFYLDGTETFLGVIWGPAQTLDPIGSAVLTFIGFERTDKQSIYIY